jgi:rhodanese-related sulfurtransferase
MKYYLLFLISITAVLTADIKVYQYSGVDVKHNGKKVMLEREIHPKCLDIPISNDQIWEGSYAHKNIPKECKATFVTSVGQIQPMSLHPEVETYGEMEVMHFFKEMQSDDSMMLIDTRGETWYRSRTIPGAVNIPHHDISKSDQFPEDYKRALRLMNVKKKNGNYDFSEAKTIALFCNGSWCSQSPGMIKNLIALGYPPEKIKWYRGGMHDWLTLSMTSTNSLKESTIFE